MAQIKYGLNYQNLDPTAQRWVAWDAYCYNSPDACREVDKKQAEENRQVLFEIIQEVTGFSDAEDCTGGEVPGCAWTILSYGNKWTAAGSLVASIPTVGTIILESGDSVYDVPWGGLCSFSGDTKVLMADGTTKPISDVKVGDQVLATNPETGEEGPRTVTHLWVHEDTIVALSVDGELVNTTEDHPYWNATDKQWQRADRLGDGDYLRTSNGLSIRVDGLVDNSSHTALAYNLTVDDIHTYYVLAGDAPVLVHNTGPECGLGPDGWPVPTMDNCEACAKHIQNIIGGDVYNIKDAYGAPGLGPSEHDPLGKWTEHYAVIKEGVVYDGFTGRSGMPFDAYRAQWIHGEYLSFTPVE